MRNGHADDIATLIKPGRVHRRVYTDPDLFELEMERIFGCAWLFVGHASQVPNPGDYITTELGRQPVIMVRHRDGSVQVLLNRCSHRGAKVVNDRCGHAQRLVCCYHGWAFDTDGKLVTVPVPEGCGAGFDKDALGLGRAPRVGEYRGFVFASLAKSGAELRGPYRPDEAQHRRSRRSRARRRTRARCSACTATSITATGSCRSRTCSIPITCRSATPRRLTSKACSSRAAKAIRKAPRSSRPRKSRPRPHGRTGKSFTIGNGHGWTSNTALDEGKRSSPVYDEYTRALAEKVGAERAAYILTPRLHNSLIYPNMSIMGLNIHVRVIKPIAVDRTEVHIYPIRLIGAPEAMNFANIRLLNVTHSAASFVQTDDLESFVRAQKGLQSRMTDWVDISRGLGAEEPDRELNATRELATHEMAMRAQYKAWLGYMHEAA